MRTSEINDILNDLMDLARAGEYRLAGTSGLVGPPALKAHLSLQAAEHAREAEALLALVREFRGTPHDGMTDAVLADPLWRTPPSAQQGDRYLLQACADEEAADIERFEEALRVPGFPPQVLRVLRDCRTSAEHRRRRLDELLSGEA